MSMFTVRTTKTLSLGCATLLTSFIAAPTHAADSGSIFNSGPDYLQQIAEYTYGTMQTLNVLPLMALQSITLSYSWLQADQTNTTSTLQADLANYSAANTTTLMAQISKESLLTQELFGSRPTPNANDLSFSTLLGTPFYAKDPRLKDKDAPIDSAYNYVKHAAGMSINHVMPGRDWTGAASDQKTYQNYYNTITAVESYNTYILSQLYADSQSNAVLSAQQQLMNDAGNSNWFAQVASENLGVVLRQILMFNSQMLIVMTQLLATEKELLTAQAMTNTMLVLTGQSNEQLLMRKAVQAVPGGG